MTNDLPRGPELLRRAAEAAGCRVHIEHGTTDGADSIAVRIARRETRAVGVWVRHLGRPWRMETAYRWAPDSAPVKMNATALMAWVRAA